MQSLGYALSGAPRPHAVHQARYLCKVTRGTLVLPRRVLARQVDLLRGAPDVRAKLTATE